ncbi:hypothetical protein [Paraburkholderia sp. JPY419]|uniref:hypothetical protein n=1 Tax=Paraburkholderia sp. JPY419 TaxID=667660 RepID=UPI003D200921
MTKLNIEPWYAAFLRPAPSRHNAAVAPTTRHKTGATPAKPKATTKTKPTARAAVSTSVSHAASRGDFAHLMPPRTPQQPAAQAALATYYGNRKATLTREKSAQLARQIVAVNNRRLGLTQDTGKPHTQANTQTMTPLAAQILAVARRIGLET